MGSLKGSCLVCSPGANIGPDPQVLNNCFCITSSFESQLPPWLLVFLKIEDEDYKCEVSAMNGLLCEGLYLRLEVRWAPLRTPEAPDPPRCL